MSDKNKNTNININVKEVAKQALQKLYQNQESPIPENYSKAFFEISKEEQKVLVNKSIVEFLISNLNSLGINLNIKNLNSINFEILIETIKYNITEKKKEELQFQKNIIFTILSNIGNIYDNIEIKEHTKSLIEKYENINNSEQAEFYEQILVLFKKILKDVKNIEDNDTICKYIIDNLDRLFFEDKTITLKINNLKQIITEKTPQKIFKVETLLKEIIDKQIVLKDDLIKSQLSLQNILSQFIVSLSDFTEETGDYHNFIDVYSKEIKNASNMEDITETLSLVLKQTSIISEKTKSESPRPEGRGFLAGFIH